MRGLGGRRGAPSPARAAGAGRAAEAAAGAPAGASGLMAETTLDNGVRVLSERVPGVRSAAIGVWVRRGAAHEDVADHGVSHLLEHMVFKGTAKREAREIAVALEGLGGSLDAYTTREHTAYQARVLDQHVPEALDVLADLVLEPLLRDEDLELEREVVLEEIAQVDDTPDDLVFELHGDRLWQGHPYGRSILGTESSVGGLTTERLGALHRGHYVGANLVVAGAGNVEHAELVAGVADLFGRLGAGTASPPVGSPGPAATGSSSVSRDSAQTHIVFGAPGPAHSSEERHAVILLSAALGGGMSSRLFQRVREELGLCYSVFTYHSFYQRGGVVGVYVGTRPATADEAVEAVRAELTRVAAEGLPAEELERTKRQVSGQIMISLESTSARLYRLASFALYDEPFLGLDELLGIIDGVSAEQVRDAAAKYFDPGTHFELRLGPS